jgi:hypothetical protein
MSEATEWRWRVYNAPELTGSIYSVHVAEGPNHPCLVCTLSNAFLPRVTEEHARLIASAPALLAACKAAVSPNQLSHLINDQLRAAIALAEGQQQEAAK